MGLDMYLYSVKCDQNIAVKDFPKREDGYWDKEKLELEEIGYWRKHPNLHGYIEKLYIESGGEEEFNCVPFELSEEQIEEIIELTEEDGLRDITGFFFGESTEFDNENTIKIMSKALREISKGRRVIYDSWW